jgi:hypothetical protein
MTYNIPNPNEQLTIPQVTVIVIAIFIIIISSSGQTIGSCRNASKNHPTGMMVSFKYTTNMVT